MNEKSLLLRTADAVSEARNEMMGIATCCQAMEGATGEEIWGTIYRSAVAQADKLDIASDDLSELLSNYKVDGESQVEES